MIPIYEVKTIQIEVTNACNLTCANCTRFVGHHQKPFFMSLDEVRTAIKSLEGFKNGIGLMGGEPTVHPQFAEICKTYQELIADKHKRQFWTNGYGWKKYEKLIYETFEPKNIVYNDHKNPVVGWHQPLMVAAKDILDDESLMWELINDCWIQERWSASITPKGAFFCEVAAAQDHLYSGTGGYPIEKGWWNKTPEQFREQAERYCPNCSAAIPMPKESAHNDCDTVSKSIAEKLEKVMSPKFLKGKVQIFDRKFSRAEIEEYKKDWTPWSHRPYKQYTPDLIEKC
ncbi:MAG: radical SAM protein [Alphaproteobacteria bacterium]|uniref:Radical SAM protein n=1 Tax=Candidatus Nitrobium versatile TaxID=2884831 RepID=A0A953J9I0_9BACT|nr:radical SAM protein [Candidatus Nitrobium versatile]